MEVVDSESLPLPSQVLRELASEITTVSWQLIDLAMCSKQDVINAHAQWNVLETR